MKVAVAVIKDLAGRILITRRALNTHLGGLWEFPGGKLEPDETAEAALTREVEEELGLSVVKASHVATIQHSYETQNVELYVFKITKFTGTASCRASQIELRWVDVDEIRQFEFPKANEEIFVYLG